MSNIMSSFSGFVFTTEALLALILFGLIIFSLPLHENTSLKELALMQQGDDLLRVWSAGDFSEQRMIADTNILFENHAELWIDETQLLSAPIASHTLVIEDVLLDTELHEKKIRILIHYD